MHPLTTRDEANVPVFNENYKDICELYNRVRFNVAVTW